MKLYTEEELRKHLFNHDERFFNELTPIELPNDEEISYEAITWDVYNMTQIEAFKHGTKWMKEQILNQNK
jgi:hypothetical protein